MNQRSTFGQCSCCNPCFHLLSEQFTLPRLYLLLGTGAFAATVLASQSNQASQSSNTSQFNAISQQDAVADAIYIGEVITVNDAQPTAEAVAIKLGKILAVGSRDQVMEFQGDATQIIDLNGKTIVPGFIDGHGHILIRASLPPLPICYRHLMVM
ncbi:MAG: hypothetical protein JO235_19055 [Chroococcidiopsidaceae cyanobacterium CP_BM_RX_35]|nr:hypothetical protein [Chroococcidiopsidaceae cyanobacterium CP_BM_RX_35]